MTGFQLFYVNRDGCHMWGRKCSLFPFGELYYILLNLSVLGLCLWINDSGLFVWISLTALSRTYFIRCISNSKRFAIIHDDSSLARCSRWCILLRR